LFKISDINIGNEHILEGQSVFLMNLFSIIVVSIMTFFSVVAIVDSLFLKNRFGLGSEFIKGIEMIGPLCMAIIGIIALIPSISWVIERTITPIYIMFGLDPSMAVASIVAIDMGGFQLAKSVAIDPLIGKWAGIVYGSMMGATIVFSIPVGLASIEKKDITSFSKGILYGMAAIPSGTFVGGILLHISVTLIIKNLILPTAFSFFLIICLSRFPEQTTNVFKKISEMINVVSMIGLALAMIKDQVLIPLSDSGLINIGRLPFFSMLGSVNDGIWIAGSIGLILSGTFPFVLCLNRLLKKPLQKMGKRMNMSEMGITGLLLSAANNMAMFASFDKMREKEKVLNVAFAVCAAFVIGDHLAFTAANAPECIASMMVGKLASGVTALIFVSLFYKEKDIKD